MGGIGRDKWLAFSLTVDRGIAQFELGADFRLFFDEFSARLVHGFPGRTDGGAHSLVAMCEIFLTIFGPFWGCHDQVGC